MHNKIMT